MEIINIISKRDYDAKHTYRKALGYPWQDLSRKIPGNEIVMAPGKYDETRSAIMATLRAKHGDIYESAAPVDNQVAIITGLWCGGETTYIGKGQKTGNQTRESLPLDATESTTMDKRLDQIDQDEQDNQLAAHPGYCRKCHSYCYGDCQA